MAAWRYEISLLALKIFHSFARNVLFIIMNYQTISLKQFFFPAKGAIYYVAIATVISSHVKIYFHM